MTKVKPPRTPYLVGEAVLVSTRSLVNEETTYAT